ncbi:MAG: PilZ domain-containing protein [Nitrospirota bacterium]
MFKESRREHSREPFVTFIRYSVTVMDMRDLKRIRDTAVSVDIGIGGMGMITGYPLEVGHILTFEDDIEVNNITAKAAVVRWIGKAESNKYRVGLRFI